MKDKEIVAKLLKSGQELFLSPRDISSINNCISTLNRLQDTLLNRNPLEDTELTAAINLAVKELEIILNKVGRNPF